LLNNGIQPAFLGMYESGLKGKESVKANNK